ncbi:MAG: D-tyrosyl-tRNA(Tyr) deacylase [Bacteroidetes bacterium]|nr:MAG: D-tyrosyl-tRNA(Tyr) deacylase [Bacteroidota bacterium]
MRAVIQRVSESRVKINNQIAGEIKKGMLILLGIEEDDNYEDIRWLASKIVNLRIFSDTNGKMNLSVKDIDGGLLVVSQFTLHASTKKGNRPSFVKAAKPEKAIHLYNQFIKECEQLMNKKVETGQFGANMEVYLVNEGPVTIIIDSKNKE